MPITQELQCFLFGPLKSIKRLVCGVLITCYLPVKIHPRMDFLHMCCSCVCFQFVDSSDIEVRLTTMSFRGTLHGSQTLALLPHSVNVLGRRPGLSVCMFSLCMRGYSSFLPRPTKKKKKRKGYSELSVGVNGCLSLFVSPVINCRLLSHLVSYVVKVLKKSYMLFFRVQNKN